ncbi:hypothetical protein [Georgenia soli]|uniref:hypothetical protein n=1 Tax=Georgenia soli TaxID=638953 RepID=UPI000BF5B428|nr:hypothetical protein [Georgenia soli]
MSKGDALTEHVGEPSGRRRLTDSEASELATAYVADVRTGRIHPPEWGARDTREEVENYIAHGPDPLRLLDAILQQEIGDDEVTEDVGLGLLVGLIPDRRDLWKELDERCRRDPRWARRPGTRSPTNTPLPGSLPTWPRWS